MLYGISKNGVIFDELKRIFMKYEFLDEMIRRELPAGIKYALIYGSFARGMEQANSDIDLLVIGSVDEDKILKPISNLERETGRVINYNLWSEEEFFQKAREKIPLLNEIQKTPVMMIAGDEGEFNRTIRQGPG